MSIRKIHTTLFFLCFVGVSVSFGQQKTEKKAHKSDCFRGRLEIIKTYPTTENSKDGRLEVVFPAGSEIREVVWVTYKGGIKERSVSNLKPGYYHLYAIDGNNCKTRVNDIELTESK